MTIYQLTDRLQDGRAVRVQADQIAATVGSWLAELGACSPLVELLGRAVRDGERNRSYVHRLASIGLCSGILGNFHSPLLEKTRLATLR